MTREAGAQAPAGDPLKILVDATIVKPAHGGYRTYTVELVAALSGRADCELTVVTSDTEAFSDLATRVRIISVSERVQEFGPRAVWREARLASLARRLGADVVWAPVPEVPLRQMPVPLVVTIHDVSPLVAPALFGRQRFVRYLVGLSRAIEVADQVVCVSTTTLNLAHSFLGVDPDRCTVVGEGVRRGIGETAHTVGGPRRAPFVLYAGGLLPHKNVETLVRSVAHQPDDHPTELVIVGPLSSAERDRLDELVERCGVRGRVHHLGFVTTEELAQLYRHAVAFAFPSVIEGFGLPVLEAMKTGTPVIASDIPAVREVAGDAVCYIGATLEPSAWERAITDLRRHPERAARMVAAGRARADRWQWADAATSLSAVFAGAARRI